MLKRHDVGITTRIEGRDAFASSVAHLVCVAETMNLFVDQILALVVEFKVIKRLQTHTCEVKVNKNSKSRNMFQQQGFYENS